MTLAMQSEAMSEAASNRHAVDFNQYAGLTENSTGATPYPMVKSHRLNY